jgi:hypothetical protein
MTRFARLLAVLAVSCLVGLPAFAQDRVVYQIKP